MREEKSLLMADVLSCPTDARFVYPIIDRFSLQLISPVSWEIIPSTWLVHGMAVIVYIVYIVVMGRRSFVMVHNLPDQYSCL